MVAIETLQVGDRFVSSHGPTVVVLREAQTYRDWFGIERLRLWCKRVDTNEEGYVFYGYGALVTKA